MPSLISTLKPLPTDLLFAGLFYSTAGYHWILFATDGTTVSDKFHATNRQGGWQYQKATHSIWESRSLFAAVQFAQLHGRTADELDGLLRTIPMAVPPSESAGTQFTCRIWFREAVRVLHREGIVNVPDVDELEAELKGLAADAQAGVESGEHLPFYGPSRLFKA